MQITLIKASHNDAYHVTMFNNGSPCDLDLLFTARHIIFLWLPHRNNADKNSIIIEINGYAAPRTACNEVLFAGVYSLTLRYSYSLYRCVTTFFVASYFRNNIFNYYNVLKQRE
jgi:hypothetical protein